MDKLRIALCGCWGHIEKFGQLLNSFEESEVVAIWDNVDGRGERVAEALDCVCERDYDRLISEYGLDGVAILAENVLHKELIIKAAKKGIHIFVEKPLCVSSEEAREIQQVIHESGVHFFMSDPFVRAGTIKLKELISKGDLGEITDATFRIARNAALAGHINYNKAQTQGGIVADIGGHAIHQAHYLFGMPRELFAMLNCYTEKGRENGIEETALVSMRYPDGKLVSLECSWVCGVDSCFGSVHGTLGSAEITKEEGGKPESERLTLLRKGKQPELLSQNTLGLAPTRHVRYWVEMIVKDTPNDMIGVDPLSNSGVSIDHAVEYVEIIEAIYRSAQTGTVVQLDRR